MIRFANILTTPSNKATKTTLTQRIARGVMVTACSVIGLGVAGTMAFGSKQPATHFVPNGLALSATTGAAQVEKTAVTGGVELMHDAPAAVTTGSTHIVKMNVTAYCPCPKCCGKNAAGITASGKPITFAGGHFVAAPSGYTFGTKLVIKGYNDGQPVQVLDRGGAIKGNHLDVFFPTHEQAKAWGRRMIDVTVID
jgi:3D (Asp-Asp-Asp) domain-containing protein